MAGLNFWKVLGWPLAVSAIIVLAASGHLIGQHIRAKTISAGDLLSFVGAVFGAGFTVWFAAALARADQKQKSREAMALLRNTVASIWAASEGACAPRERYAGASSRGILGRLRADIEYLTEADGILEEAMSAARDKPINAIATLHRLHSGLSTQREFWEKRFNDVVTIESLEGDVPQEVLESIALGICVQAEELRRRTKLAASVLGVQLLPASQWQPAERADQP